MRQECKHGQLARSCEICDLEAIKTAARKLFQVKGRHNSQVAMCELGELLGYPVTWPVKEIKSERC